MQIFKLCSLAAAALVFATLPGYAADAAHGLDLATRWCASCHLVTPDQQTANADAPPFATIARAPHFGARLYPISCSIRTRKCPNCR